MNCLTEALGLALPGNGSTLATHAARRGAVRGGRPDRRRALPPRYYDDDDESVLPRIIATRAAFENAMALDVAMGGSTNTVLHLLAAAHEAEVDFDLDDIDAVSRRVPCLCKVAPELATYHMEDVHRAGGIPAILGELRRGGLLDADVHTVHSPTLDAWLADWDMRGGKRRPTTGHRAVPRRARRGAHHRAVLHDQPLELTRHRRRGRLHPRRRARLHRRRRAGDPPRQPRPGRRDRQDRRRPRGAVALRGPGAGRRVPGGGRRRHPRRSSVSPATWSSSATRAPGAARACRRCCTRPPSSRAAGSARRAR